RPEHPEAHPQRPPGERAALQVLLEAGELTALAGRLGRHDALLHELLALAARETSLHASSTADVRSARAVPRVATAPRTAPMIASTANRPHMAVSPWRSPVCNPKNGASANPTAAVEPKAPMYAP